MKITNSFNEEIQISVEKNSTPEEIKMEIQRKYGLPTQNQRLDKLGSNYLLSIQDKVEEEILLEIPNELKELGVSENNYNLIFASLKLQGLSLDSSELKRYIFPYLYEEKPKYCVFKGIRKDGLEDTEAYVNQIPDSQKETILKNLESYITSFLKKE